MKNTIKMSLVAALAVAGMTTSASADITDDIQFSGKIYVEHLITNKGNEKNESAFDIDVDITAKKKLTDELTAVLRVEGDSENDNYESDDVEDGETIYLDNAYIAYANAGLSAKFGKQDIDTPTTDGEIGEGLLASYTMGSVTALGAYFDTNEFSKLDGLEDDIEDDFDDVSVLALLGTAGPINYELWNVGIGGFADNITAKVSGKIKNVSLGLAYAVTDYDNRDINGKTYIFTAAAKIASVKLSAKYLVTDEDGAAFSTNDGNDNSIDGALIGSKMTADTTAYLLSASMPFTKNITGSLGYFAYETDSKEAIAKDTKVFEDDSEISAQIKYKLSKSTSMSVRYSTTDTSEWDETRIDLAYKF